MNSIFPLIAHRGASAYAPENTIAAFRLAAQQGTNWVECDAKLTRDNKVILFHDDQLDRTSDGKGHVKDHDWADLANLDAGSWFGSEWKGEPIPLLKAAIECWEHLGLQANIEIKPCPGRDQETAYIVMEELKRLWPQSKPLPLISSFSIPALREAKRIAPDFPRGLLLEDYPSDWRELARDLSVISIHCWDKEMTPEWAKDIRKAGYYLLIYTVNDTSLAKKLFSWGANSLFTDRPRDLQVVL